MARLDPAHARVDAGSSDRCDFRIFVGSAGPSIIRVAAVDGGENEQVSPVFEVYFNGAFTVSSNETDYSVRIGSDENAVFSFCASTDASGDASAVINGETVYAFYSIVNSNTPGAPNGDIAGNCFMLPQPALSAVEQDYSFQFSRTNAYAPSATARSSMCTTSRSQRLFSRRKLAQVTPSRPSLVAAR